MLATTAPMNPTRTTPAVALPFAAIVLAMLPAVLDQTILAAVLPTIAADLGRVTDVSWVVTAYVVAAAAATPVWGKLGDRLGRGRLLQLALVLFLSASAACGLAQSVEQLIGARVVQGAAAGGLMVLAMAAVGDLVAPRERARYQGYIAASFAVATIAGPLLGGVLVDGASWRWVFYVNLPVGLAAIAGLRLRLPAPAVQRPTAPLDVAGATLLAAATAAFVLVCVSIGEGSPWTSARVLALAGTTVVAGALLVVRERRAADPIVPLDLLRTRTVAVSSAALFLATASLFAVTVFVPLFLQTTTGASPTEAGLLLVPMMGGIVLSTNLVGRAISRTGRYRRYPLAGLGLMAGALLGLAAVAGDPSRTSTGLALAVFGLGFGMVGQVLTTAVQNAVEQRQLGVAMATTSFFRGLGGAVGAAVLGAVFAAQAGGATGEGAVSAADVMDGVQAVFLVAAPLAAIGLLVALLLRETPLATHVPSAGPPAPGRGTEPTTTTQEATVPSLSVHVHVRSEESPTAPGVIELQVGPGWDGPPLHHHAFDETFYVLEGELTFQVGDVLVARGPGSCVFAPGGSVHTLANVSDEPARYLLVCTPGGFERRFDDEPHDVPPTTMVGPTIHERLAAERG